MRALLVAALLFSASATAQTPFALALQAGDGDALAITMLPDPVSTASSVVGTYAGGGSALYVARSGDRVVLTLAGQAAFDAFADAPGEAAFNARAEALLRDALAGSTDRLAAALPAHRRDRGTQDFARLLAALSDRLGPTASVDALGTSGGGVGIAQTFVVGITGQLVALDLWIVAAPDTSASLVLTSPAFGTVFVFEAAIFVAAAAMALDILDRHPRSPALVPGE